MILFILFFCFLIGVAAFSYLFVDQHLSYLHNLYTGYAVIERTQTTVLFLGSIVGLAVFYWLFLKKKLTPKQLLVGVVGMSIIGLFAYPAMLSYDIFNYIFTAKVTFFYRENPYITMPIAFLNDPLLAFTHAANKVALYGPVWILITAIPFLLGMHQFVLTLLLFKLLSICAFLGCCYFLWKLSRSTYAVALFAFNPLIVLELVFHGHNDSMMMLLLLGALYLLKNKKIFWAIVLILLSIGIKYATLFFMPIFVYIFYLILKNKKIPWERIYLFSFISMFFIFLLSAFREEIYPWYATWFLPFVYLSQKRKVIFWSVQVMSISLLLRYVPFMYIGTHFGSVPLIKTLVTFVPILIVISVVLVKQYLMKRK